MGEVTLTWEGLDEIIATYGRASQVVREEMEEAAYRTFAVATRALKTYPGARSSTYVRTGRLGRGWDRDPHFRIGRGSIGVSLTNPVPYAGLVQGERQAKVHRGYWLSITVVQAQIQNVYGPLYVNDALGNIARYLESGQR